MITLLLPAWLKRLMAKIIFRRQPKETRCPDCLQVVEAVPITAEALWDTRLDCPSCGAAFSYADTVKTGNRSERHIGTVSNRVEVARPTHSRIEVAEKEGVRGWHLPPRKGCNFLLGFGTVWTLFSSGLFSVFAFAGPASGQAEAKWVPLLMGGVFVVIGLGILYAGIRMSRIRHWIWVTDEALLHEQQFFGTRRQIYARNGIRSVELVVFYTQNYEPVHGIEIVGAEGKLRFGSGLDAEDKAWLCQDIRRTLGWEVAASEAPAAAVAAPPPSGSSFRIDRQADGSCALNGSFGSQTTILMLVGLFFAFIGGVMIYNGPQVGSESSPLPFKVFEVVFSLIWYLPLTAFALAGLAVSYTGYRLRRVRYEVRVDRNGVELEIWGGRNPIFYRHWPPQAIYSVQVRSSGNAKNGANAIGQQHVQIAVDGRIVSIGGDAREPQLHEATDAIIASLAPWQNRSTGLSQSAPT
ncbi:MAG: hypothetical protein H7A55_18340 [Verrucomicrobiaceae bacterium]|nr:hypothetical protein [Verrucomicrobiaceae bacterium]